MNGGMAVQLMADLLQTALVISLPILGVIMLVGVAISILQVVTQVQEMSLSFVPKLTMAAIALVIFGPWMLRKLAQFSTNLWASIPSLFS